MGALSSSKRLLASLWLCSKSEQQLNLWCAACMRGITHESYYPVEELANGRISRACPSSFTVGSSQAREEKIAHDKSPSSRRSKWINGCGLPTVFASSVSAPLLGSCGRTPCRWWETCSMPCISRGEGAIVSLLFADSHRQKTSVICFSVWSSGLCWGTAMRTAGGPKKKTTSNVFFSLLFCRTQCLTRSVCPTLQPNADQHRKLFSFDCGE